MRKTYIDPCVGSLARVVLFIGRDYYVFAFKEEAKEFLRQ
jgi:prefoldin subunit 5